MLARSGSDARCRPRHRIARGRWHRRFILGLGTQIQPHIEKRFSASFDRPVTLRPYFEELNMHFNNQYLLTFAAPGGGKKGKFERVRVVTEVPNVQYLTPSEVFLPPSQ